MSPCSKSNLLVKIGQVPYIINWRREHSHSQVMKIEFCDEYNYYSACNYVRRLQSRRSRIRSQHWISFFPLLSYPLLYLTLSFFSHMFSLLLQCSSIFLVIVDLSSSYTVKNVVCPAHHFAVTPVECMHTFKLSVAITPNYVVCMHTL